MKKSNKETIIELEKKRFVTQGAQRVIITTCESVHAVVYLRTKPNMITATGYSGKRKGSDFSYKFKTAEAREEHVRKWVGRMEKRAAEKQTARDAKKKPHTLVVGDVVSTSWGWEQTNVDFYQVVALKAKTMVVLREIAAKQVDDSHVVPSVDNFVGEAFSKRVDPQYNSIKISSCQRATPQGLNEDGSYKASYKTPWGMGH